VVFGDAGYASDEYKRGARALGMAWRVQDKAKPKRCYGASGEDKASSSLDTTDGDAPCRSQMT
jgi:hypothetical protein